MKWVNSEGCEVLSTPEALTGWLGWGISRAHYRRTANLSGGNFTRLFPRARTYYIRLIKFTLAHNPTNIALKATSTDAMGYEGFDCINKVLRMATEIVLNGSETQVTLARDSWCQAQRLETLYNCDKMSSTDCLNRKHDDECLCLIPTLASLRFPLELAIGLATNDDLPCNFLS